MSFNGEPPGWLDEGAHANEPFTAQQSSPPPPPARGIATAEAVPINEHHVVVEATPYDHTSSHNPFDDDDADTSSAPTGGVPSGPTVISSNASSNPFGDEEDEDDLSPAPKPAKSSYNPFGDDDDSTASTSTSGPALHRPVSVPQHKPSITLPPRIGTMGESPFPNKSVGPAGVGILGDPSGPKRAANLTFDTDKKPQGSSVLLPKDLRSLVERGYEVNAAREALNKAGNVALAEQRLYAGVNQFGNGSSNGLWRPPLAVRVGSWLPNIASDKEASDFHTGYIATVSICCSNISWQVTHRYSNFRDLHDNVMRAARKERVQVALNAPFPMDRLHNVFFGMTDEVRNRRQGQLDAWLKELLTTPAYMANAAIQDVVIDFLEAKVPMRGSTDAQLISRGDSMPELGRGARSMGNPF